MAKEKKFIREYPDTWPPGKVFEFLVQCKKLGGVPLNHKLKVKHLKRKGLKRLTFTWKD